MIEQCVHSLERVLIPLKEDSYLEFLINTQNYVNNEQKILQKIENPLKNFQKEFANLKEKQTEEVLKNLSQILGYGLGSTPESDDLFLGVLIAKYCLNEEVCENFEYLTKIPYEKLTTSKSAQLIRSFLNLNFPSEIHPFIELLTLQLEDNQVKLKFEHEIRKIRTFGTSSGYYFLVGILWELKNNLSIQT